MALKSGETMSVPVKCLHEMPPALDPDEHESEPPASGDPGMECESSRAEVHMAVDSDSPVPKPSRGEPRDAADLERGELEQEQTDSQMTDAPSSPEPAHSSNNPSDWSSPAAYAGQSSLDPDDYSSESD